MPSYMSGIFGQLQSFGEQNTPGYGQRGSVLPNSNQYYNPTTEYGRMQSLRNLQSQGGATSQGNVLQRGVTGDQGFDYLTRVATRDFASGAGPSQLADILGTYFQPSADRYGQQLPGLEEEFLNAIRGGVNFDETYATQERFGQGLLDQFTQPGGEFDALQFSGLGNTVRQGQSPLSGSVQQGRLNILDRFGDKFSSSLAQNQASLYQTATQGHLGQLGAYGSAIQNAQQGFQDSRESLFTGQFGIENLKMSKLQQLMNMFGTKANIDTARMAAEPQGGGIGGFLGAAAGSLLGPIGGAVGGKIGSMIFSGK